MSDRFNLLMFMFIDKKGHWQAFELFIFNFDVLFLVEKIIMEHMTLRPIEHFRPSKETIIRLEKESGRIKYRIQIEYANDSVIQ